jgi:hypothetical protein
MVMLRRVLLDMFLALDFVLGNHITLPRPALMSAVAATETFAWLSFQALTGKRPAGVDSRDARCDPC